MTARLTGFQGKRGAAGENAGMGWSLAPAIYGDISIGSVLAIESPSARRTLTRYLP